MSKRVFANGTADSVALWASEAWCDGTPRVPFFRHGHPCAFMLDGAWLLVNDPDAGRFGMVRLAQPGALASVLSTLVES